MSPDPEASVLSPLQLLAEQDPQAAEDLWRFRNPEKGGKKLSLKGSQKEVPLRYGFTVSLDALHRFYRWLGLRRRMQEARETADQVKEELRKDPDITEEEIDRVAGRVFKTEMMVERNVKGYVAIARVRQGDKKLGQDDRRIALLEKKARERDEAAELKRQLNEGGKLMPEQQREAILDKMDEILGLKK